MMWYDILMLSLPVYYYIMYCESSLCIFVRKMLPLPAFQKDKCFRVCFRFQFLSSKCFRFYKNLTASASSFRFHIPA